MYKYFLRAILFLFRPETAHKLTFSFLKALKYIPFAKPLSRVFFWFENQHLERELFGLKFKNPVGLAAGLDKNAEAFDSLYNFGFSFVEIGTVTPLGQPGNEKPRLFRLVKDKALINRMGFNNNGVEAAVEKLKKRKSNVIIGGNIGKNTATSNDDAKDDYVKCFNALHDHVDYFTVNVSCPNVTDLRELQDKDSLLDLLSTLKDLNSSKLKPKPILLKLSPDLNNAQLDDTISIVEQLQIDGVVAVNTTTLRNDLSYSEDYIKSIGRGGLSGKPIKDRSTKVIKYIHEKTEGRIPIIGVGGIMNVEDALEKIKAGASLVQIYTGFVYEGPSMIKKINKAIVKQFHENITD